MKITATRRALLLAAATGAALVGPWARSGNLDDSLRNEDRGPGEQKAVGSVEDLMRGHGVLRRILLVYEQSADKLRDGHSVNLGALNDAARLFRTFGEDHHEKTLEEAFIFPTLRKLRGPASSYPDILSAQHHRGRAITDYILETTERPKLNSGRVRALARAFDSFAMMYQNHAAREDTLVFPLWKQALEERELEDLGYQFEEIDQQQFGKEGFDIMLEQIAAIENALGYADLAQFTAPLPPRVA